MFSASDLQFYHENGYIVARGLFSPDEAAYFRAHYMYLRENGSYDGDDLGVQQAGDPNADPLKRYPRMIHMHRWDETSLRYMLDNRIRECMVAILGREPYGVQTMLYFKPPGARGQALHQDNYFLRAQPETCIAAWTALDVVDEANGCLMVVPGSHTWPLLCTVPADTTQSFTDVAVPLPEGTPVVPVIMQPGDTLFFNGALVHGSMPNVTTDRFRRALIAHYIEGNSEQVAAWYNPIYRFDGATFSLQASELGGRCGVWVNADGTPVIEVVGYDQTKDATAV